MDNLLQQGIAAHKAGKRDEARNIFITVVKQNPDSERAWGWMYNVCVTDQERIHCLKQILRINPKNEKANELIVELTSFEPPLEHPQPKSLVNTKSTTQVAPPDSKNTSIIIAICLGIALIILVSGPIWPTFEWVKQEVLVQYITKLSAQGFSVDKIMEMGNAPNSPLMDTLKTYNMSFTFRSILIGVCILFLLFDIICILINKTLVPNLFWYLFGFLFIAFSLEYLFLSWDMFITPGPILSLISALLFVFFGLNRIKSKTQNE